MRCFQNEIKNKRTLKIIYSLYYDYYYHTIFCAQEKKVLTTFLKKLV